MLTFSRFKSHRLETNTIIFCGYYTEIWIVDELKIDEKEIKKYIHIYKYRVNNLKNFFFLKKTLAEYSQTKSVVCVVTRKSFGSSWGKYINSLETKILRWWHGANDVFKKIAKILKTQVERKKNLRINCKGSLPKTVGAQQYESCEWSSVN